MSKFRKIKILAISLIIALNLFYAPHILVAQENKTGSLMGYIYGEDCMTPVEGVVITIRNISNGSVYEGEKSNKLGAFKLDRIEEGLYTVGIRTENGGFNIPNVIGIKANEMALVSLALIPQAQEKAAAKKDEKCPRGDWYYPEDIGKCDAGYRWNPKTLRCECEKGKGIGSFFGSPLGIAVALASTAAGVYGIVKLTEKEEEVSPYK